MPAVSICTSAFRIPAAAMAKAYGFPDFQYLEVPHPVASLNAEGLRQRVEEVLPRVLEILGAGQ